MNSVLFENYSRRPKNVYITIDHTKLNKNRYQDQSLCEIILGIYPGTIYDSEKKEHKIIAQGLVPNNQSFKHKKFKIGDLILTINDVHINRDNIEQYLNLFKAHKHLKISVLSQLKSIKFDDSLNEESSVVSSLKSIEIIQGDRAKETTIVYDIPHTLMILSINDDDNDENNEREVNLIYKYPKNNDSFVLIRGVFLTIALATQDISSKSQAKYCKFSINNQKMFACFINKKDYFIVITVPSEFIDIELLEAVTMSLSRAIDYSYDNLKLALNSPTNRKHLDCLFSLFFQRLLLKHDLTNLNIIRYNDELKMRLFDVLPWLQLPDTIKIQFDELLNNFEAYEFLDFDGQVSLNTKQFYILGCCLFYKHHTIVTHLSVDKTKLIYNYCDNYGLFILSSNVISNEIQVWKEVYCVKKDKLNRNYMILVGYREFILGVLLETFNVELNPNESFGADPLLMEQSRLLLDNVNESGLMSKVNEWYLKGSKLQLADVNSFLNKKQPKNSPKLPRKENDYQTLNYLVAPNEIISSMNRFTVSNSDICRDYWSFSKFPHNALKDSIFYYIHSEENSNGILISPTKQDVDLLYSDIYADVLNGFMSACLKIKKMFDYFKKNSYPLQGIKQENIIEQGIQFEIQRASLKKTDSKTNISNSRNSSPSSRKNSSERDKQKSTTSNLYYWVVGRRIEKPYRRDLFICFNDSHENILHDLAFIDIAFAQYLY